MKHALRILLLLTLAVGSPLALPSCSSSPDGKAALTQAANIALTAGVVSGRITPAQAELVREYGALLLNAEDGPAKVAAISGAAVAVAEATGNLTPEQAEALRAAGTVPLEPPAPIPGSDPPPLAIEVTSSK